VVRFGVFEVDLRAGELRKQGVKVKLQEQPFQILRILLERPNEVVTREQLQHEIWPADTFVDFDHGLYNAIKKLREALGDTASTPRFIETLPRRGYRFVGPLNENGHATVVAPRPAEPSAVAASSARRWWSRTAALVLLAIGTLLLLVLPSSVHGKLQNWFGRADAPQIHSLAVLPLKNLSDDPAQNYFSYGMTEELITDLAQISGLKVISHTSVLQYENSGKPLPQIARELGVDGIVEGTVQRSGKRVRITAQLIYAPEEQHLWAASYDRDVGDVLALESNVAAAIVEPIRAKTASSGAALGKVRAWQSPNALEDYLRGNYALEREGAGEGHDGYKDALTYFKKAIDEDPTFAAAYVQLAVTYDQGFDWRANDKMPFEKAAVKKALELDPELADAHLMNAGIKISYDCDLPGAAKEYEEALRINPNLADAHGGLSGYLDSVGRHDESIQEAKRAQELDPEGSHQTEMLVSSGQYDHAIEEIRKHLELHPKDGWAYIDGDGLIDVYHRAGRHRESVEALQTAWTLFGFEDVGKGVGKAYAASGYAGALRYSAQQMEHLYAEGKVQKPDYIAEWYARSGDKEQALKWIRIDLADNNHCWVGLDKNLDFTLLHNDPRFQELLKPMQLPH
jgi:TolB-like protein/DNA-binding winged helix-turn-helix (wHTH) protein/Tfp pilus assembly protein PilF